jgi:hypothetical protein
MPGKKLQSIGTVLCVSVLAWMPAQDVFALGGMAAPASNTVLLDFSGAAGDSRTWGIDDGAVPQLIFPGWDSGLINETGSFGTGGGAFFNSFETSAGSFGEGGVPGVRIAQDVPTSGSGSPDPSMGSFTFGAMSVMAPNTTLASTGLRDVTRRGEEIGGLDFAVTIKFKATTNQPTTPLDPLIIEVGYESGKFNVDEDGAIGNDLIGTSINGAIGNGISGSEVTGETVNWGRTIGRIGQGFVATGGWQTEVIQMDTLNFANAFQGFFSFDSGTFVTDDPGTPGITEGNAPLAFDAGQVVFGPTASTVGVVTMDVEFVQISGNDVVAYSLGDVSRDEFLDDTDIDMYTAALRALELDKKHRFGSNHFPTGIDGAQPYYDDTNLTAADKLEFDDMMQRALPDRGNIEYADWTDPLIPITQGPVMAQDNFFEIQRRFKLTGVDAEKVDALNTPDNGFSLSRVYNVTTDDVDVLIQDLLGTARGDVDLDGDIDAADRAIIDANLGMLDPGWADGDMNGDFVVDALDQAFAPIVALAGDLDGDGFVGIADLNIVLGAWNQTIPPADPAADPSGDNFVGIADLNVVLGNWNAGTPPSDGAAIPEPTSIALIGLGLMGLMRRRN